MNPAHKSSVEIPSKRDELLYEMIRAIKEDVLPSFHEEMKTSLTRIEKILDDHDDVIGAMDRYITEQRGQFSVWRWIVGALGISTILQWIMPSKAS